MIAGMRQEAGDSPWGILPGCLCRLRRLVVPRYKSSAERSCEQKKSAACKQRDDICSCPQRAEGRNKLAFSAHDLKTPVALSNSSSAAVLVCCKKPCRDVKHVRSMPLSRDMSGCAGGPLACLYISSAAASPPEFLLHLPKRWHPPACPQQLPISCPAPTAPALSAELLPRHQHNTGPTNAVCAFPMHQCASVRSGSR